MNYDLSIIISHFIPENFQSKNPLLKTLDIINKQTQNLNIEIIIADDGSSYTSNILNNFSRKDIIENDIRDFYYLEEKKLSKFLSSVNIKNHLITKWIYLPKLINCMSKAKTMNFGVKLSQSNYLLFLDDDNYFLTKNSIFNIIELFKGYDFIVGQIKDNNNRLRKYESNRVQGTTMGIKKNIFNKINGFGEWTEEFSCGIDSDFWIKVYNHFKCNENLKACYSNKFSTYDSQSKRWKRFTKFLQDIKLKRKFNELYFCKNYKSSKYNFSRQKNIWMDNLID